MSAECEALVLDEMGFDFLFQTPSPRTSHEHAIVPFEEIQDVVAVKGTITVSF